MMLIRFTSSHYIILIVSVGGEIGGIVNMTNLT